jgi:hypothetical protein
VCVVTVCSTLNVMEQIICFCGYRVESRWEHIHGVPSTHLVVHAPGQLSLDHHDDDAKHSKDERVVAESLPLLKQRPPVAGKAPIGPRLIRVIGQCLALCTRILISTRVHARSVNNRTSQRGLFKALLTSNVPCLQHSD